MSILKMYMMLCEWTKFGLGRFGKAFIWKGTYVKGRGEGDRGYPKEEKMIPSQRGSTIMGGQYGCGEEWHKVRWKGGQVPNQGGPCMLGFGFWTSF